MGKRYNIEICEAEYWKQYNEKFVDRMIHFIDEIMISPIDYSTLLNDEPYKKLEYLLENMDNSRELLNTISFFLKENGYNEKALVYLLIKILCKYPYDNRTNDMIKRMEQLPGIEHIYRRIKGYEFITKSGKVTVYRANEVLRRNKLLKLYQQLKIENAHLLYSLLAPEFPEDTIITCLMTELFQGFSYESYMRLNKEKGIVDITNNGFYPDDSFKNYFAPKVLVKKKAKYLSFSIPPLLEEAYKNKQKMK